MMATHQKKVESRATTATHPIQRCVDGLLGGCGCVGVVCGCGCGWGVLFVGVVRGCGCGWGWVGAANCLIELKQGCRCKLPSLIGFVERCLALSCQGTIVC